MGMRSGAVTAIGALDRIPWFTRGGLNSLALVNRTLRQVTRYLTEPAIRAHAVGQVLEHITASTRVVIGHSLGSVVAYEALSTLPPTPRLPLLITLGSPLGLSAINRRLGQPPGYPAAIRKWVNIAAPDDIVAARPDLRTVFDRDRPEDSHLAPTWRVHNGSRPHDVAHYLTKECCGNALAEALTLARPLPSR